MDKEIQRIAWSCLPKEFKEEVKKLYARFFNEKPHSDCSYGYLELLATIFGIHNLTSDAEGEETLTVSRKKVQEIYRDADNLRKDPAIPYHAVYWNAEVELLQDLFGPKCLPDESESPKLSKVEKIGKDCKDEPKLIVGDDVVFDGAVHKVVGVLPNLRLYYLSGCEDAVAESDLKPYTEPLSQNPTENCDNENVISSTETCTNVCPSPRPSQEESDRDLCDRLIQRGFKNHNRLHLASIIMAGLLASGKDKHPVKRALELADALISETKKGSEQ